MATNTLAKPQLVATKKRVSFVHNQYNSPLDLYSAEEIAQTLHRHASLLSNGVVGWVKHHDILHLLINVNFKKSIEQ